MNLTASHQELAARSARQIARTLRDVVTNPNGLDRRVHHALWRIDSSYDDAELSIGSLAVEVRLTRHHLSRLFNHVVRLLVSVDPCSRSNHEG